MYLLNTILKVAPAAVYAEDGHGHIPLWWAIRNGKQTFMIKLFEATSAEGIKNPEKLLFAFVEFIKEDFRGQWHLFREKQEGWVHTLYEQYLEGFSIDRITTHYKGQLDFLLEKLANKPEDKEKLLTQPDQEGNCFLHHLALVCPDMLRILLQNKLISSDHLKILNHHQETVKQIRRKGFLTIALVKACERGDEPKVFSLLQRPVCLNVADKSNTTLLHLVLYRALKNGNISDKNREAYYKIFCHLLKKGANPNSLDDVNMTPLRVAVGTNSLTANLFILELINAGANPLGPCDNEELKTSLDVVKGQNWNIKTAVQGAVAYDKS
jgi:hypothetical protein